MQWILFVSTVVLAVAALAATIWAGRTARRVAHYRWVAVTVVLLVLAIAQADRLGHGFQFTTWRLVTHLVFAFLALLSFPGLAWSGYRLRTDPAWRAAHKRWLAAFLLLIVAAVATSLWMFVDAVPLA